MERRAPNGKRLVALKVYVTEDVEEAVTRRAQEAGTSVSTHAARLLAEDAGFGDFERRYDRRKLMEDDQGEEVRRSARSSVWDDDAI